jgi:hypothetical protein
MYLLTDSVTKQMPDVSMNLQESSRPLPSAGPRLEMIPQGDDRENKRQRVEFNVLDATNTMTTNKKMALEVFGFGAGEDAAAKPSTTELPALSNNFVRSFVGRGLSRQTRA